MMATPQSSRFVSVRPGVRQAVMLAMACALLAGSSVAANADRPDRSSPSEPRDVEGPFELREARHLRIASFDGVALDGTLLLPDLPNGVDAPVMLMLEPYYGTLLPHHDDPYLWNNPNLPVHVMRLVGEGYAVAMISMRGTGNSEGCLDLLGEREHRDAVFLIGWLAEQPWSNGRVGMVSHSYGTAAALGAATRKPPALRTVLVSGILSDYYTLWATPQGSLATMGGGYIAGLTGSVTAAQPLSPGMSLPRSVLEHLPVIDDRLCPEYRDDIRTGIQDQVSSVRNAEFYAERRLIDRFHRIRAAVLLYHGLQDDQVFQEDLAWDGLKHAPTWVFTGQWAHSWPNDPLNSTSFAFVPDWHDRIQPWLDHWLKGVGPRPAQVGTIDYQDGRGAWRRTTAWPPAEATEEVLYLGNRTAAVDPTEGTASFRSAPGSSGAPLCQEAHGSGGLVFMTAPASERTVIAGNPFAYLRVSSDAPRGQVGVQLYDLAENFGCQSGNPHGYRLLTEGAADLEFYQGNFTAQPFPVGEPRSMRIDLPNLAEVLEPGHRLGVGVSYPAVGKVLLRSGSAAVPEITLHADGSPHSSHVVLPLVEGTFGGREPTLRYPTRPFSA